ncbi:MAG TPA: nuclear transport factor 2 family protein [Pyrinomonadaceae bacterium]|jgi:ketosteroid isomerase-like protein
MHEKLKVGSMVICVLVTALAVSAQRESVRTQNRRALVDMEHAFAKAAATKGTRDAFLEFLADDGIIFQPGPVNGKKFWTERPSRKGLLSWEPIFADVSRAGDLGYTTGPWEFRPNGPDDQPVAFGQYFTIWKKQGDGSWKAVLDRGVSSEKSFATKLLLFPLHDESSVGDTKFDLSRGRAALIKLEEEFSTLSARKGTTAASDVYLASDVRMLRQNIAPVVGKENALLLVSESAGTLTWKPAVTDVAASGDLGYTYGTYDSKRGDLVVEHGSYVRVWKKQRVVLDVMSPDPKD